MKVHVIEEVSPLGRFLAAELAAQACSQQCSGDHKQIPLALAHRMPDSFHLAASSAVLVGLNLPDMLPPELRVPEHNILQSLGIDVADALRSTQQARDTEETRSNSRLLDRLQTIIRGHTPQKAVIHIRPSKRVARWIIKRCIRAGFELVQREARCYTRDLYWCCRAVQQYLYTTLASVKRHHSPAMWAAIQNALLKLPRSTVSPQPLKEHHQHEQQCDLDGESQRLAAELWSLLEKYVGIDALSSQDVVNVTRSALRVVAVLDLLALAYMTTVPDRWRPGSDLLASMKLPQGSSGHDLPSGQTSETLKRAATYHTATKSQDPRQLVKARIAVAHELADQGLLQNNLLCADVSRLPAARPVHEYHWDDRCDRYAVTALLDSLEKDVVAAATFEPFVIRGGARSWPAVKRWTIDHLVRRGSDLSGTVRVSPSPEFPFVMAQHAAALVEVAGPGSPPTTTRNVRSSFSVLKCLHTTPVIWAA